MTEIPNMLRDKAPKWLVSLHDKVYYAFIKTFPKHHAANIFKIAFGRPINWKNPTILSEKGRWIQFYADTSLWHVLADKYKVREYLTKLGFADYLPKLYGVWEKASDIDFSTLPSSFVIKTNHGCGEVIVVSDKSKIEENHVREKMEAYLSESYGVWTAEPHYLKIKPLILAEEKLPNTSPDSSTMIDYKIFCSWGKPLFLDICYDRDPETHHAKETWYDTEWNKHDEWHTASYKPKSITKPQSINIMYDICRKTSQDMPLVRIDFYDVNGKPYIGELTFTPNGYNPECLTPETQLMIGNMIDLSLCNKRD